MPTSSHTLLTKTSYQFLQSFCYLTTSHLHFILRFYLLLLFSCKTSTQAIKKEKPICCHTRTHILELTYVVCKCMWMYVWHTMLPTIHYLLFNSKVPNSLVKSSPSLPLTFWLYPMHWQSLHWHSNLPAPYWPCNLPDRRCSALDRAPTKCTNLMAHTNYQSSREMDPCRLT